MRVRSADVARSLGTLGPVGRAGVAPGTVASAVALVAAAAIPERTYGPVLLALVIVGAACAPWAARVVAAQTGDEDPRTFVLDEAVGAWLAVLAPTRPSLAVFAAAFLLFRLFDIWKPGPIRRLERIGRGWGVVLDDLAAGGLTLVVLTAAQVFGARLWP